MRSEIEKRIERKKADITELTLKLREEEAYLKALNDTLRLFPREGAEGGREASLRPGTDLARARDAILEAGHPLHISELLKALGKEVNKQSRVSLSGNLSAYVRRGEVFTRTEPNTFGLFELEPDEVEEAEGAAERDHGDIRMTPEIEQARSQARSGVG